MPIIIRVGDYQLSSYVAMIALAAVVWVYCFKQYESKLGLVRREDFWVLVNITGFAGFLGGRLFCLFSNPPALPGLGSYAAALVSNQTGLSTFGALLGVAAGLFGACRHLKINFLRVLDYVCLAIPVGHAIARIGCFLTGCCYGRAVDDHLPWSVVYTDKSAALPPNLLGVALHPTQLYEAAGDLVVAGLLYLFVRPLVEKGRFGHGLVCAGYVAGYGLLRYVSEAFRGNPELLPGTTVPLAQIFSLVLLLVAGVLLLHAARSRQVTDPNPSTSTP